LQNAVALPNQEGDEWIMRIGTANRTMWNARAGLPFFNDSSLPRRPQRFSGARFEKKRRLGFPSEAGGQALKRGERRQSWRCGFRRTWRTVFDIRRKARPLIASAGRVEVRVERRVVILALRPCLQCASWARRGARRGRVSLLRFAAGSVVSGLVCRGLLPWTPLTNSGRRSNLLWFAMEQLDKGAEIGALGVHGLLVPGRASVLGTSFMRVVVAGLVGILSKVGPRCSIDGFHGQAWSANRGDPGELEAPALVTPAGFSRSSAIPRSAHASALRLAACVDEHWWRGRAVTWRGEPSLGGKGG